MKKYLIQFVTLLCLLCLLCSCAPDNSGKTKPAATQSLVINDSGHIPPQPLDFSTLAGVTSFIDDPTWHYAYAKAPETYSNMAEDFREDGYITTVTHDTAKIKEDEISLFPHVNTEDSGVSYRFEFKGVKYSLIVYNTLNNFMLDDYETQTIIDYFKYIKPRVTFQILDTLGTKNEQLPSVFFVYYTDTSIRGWGRLDDTHYVNILQFSNSTSQCIEFINGLHFDKLLLD